MSTDKRLSFYKEKIKSELYKVKDDIGDLRYRLYVDMVEACDDYDELKEMAELEMQLQTIEYTKNAIKNKLDEQNVSIKDIRKVYCEDYDNSEEVLEEDDEINAYTNEEEMSAMLALQLQRRLEEEPPEETRGPIDLDDDRLLTEEERLENMLIGLEDDESAIEEMYGHQEDYNEEDYEDSDEESFDIDNLDENYIEMLSNQLPDIEDDDSSENEDDFEIIDEDMDDFMVDSDEYSDDDTLNSEIDENYLVEDDSEDEGYIDLDNIDAIDDSELFMSTDDDYGDIGEQDEFDIDSEELFMDTDEDDDTLEEMYGDTSDNFDDTDGMSDDEFFVDSDEDDEQLMEMYGDTSSEEDDIEEYSAEDCIDLDDLDSLPDDFEVGDIDDSEDEDSGFDLDDIDSMDVDDMFGPDEDFEDTEDTDEDGVDLDNLDSLDVDDMFGPDEDEDGYINENSDEEGFDLDDLDSINVDDMFGPDEEEEYLNSNKSNSSTPSTIPGPKEANGLPHTTFKNTAHSSETQETFEAVGKILGKLGLAGFKGMNKVKKKINNSDFYRLPKDDD